MYSEYMIVTLTTAVKKKMHDVVCFLYASIYQQSRIMYHEVVLEDLHTFHIPLQQWIEKVHPDYPAVYLEFDMGA